MDKKCLLSKLKKLSVWVGIFSLFLLSANKIAFAVDSTEVRVNGTIIYESPGGYNEGHGIAGVTFNTETKTLNLANASVESIYANGDISINLTGNNAIDAVTSGIALESRGNLTIKGANGSSLNISAMSADDRAIELATGSTLTVGDSENLGNLITVSIQRGRNVNTEEHKTIVDGNTYNYTAPGGGDGGGVPPRDPLKISINGSLVIDETAEPPVTSATGSGWSISQSNGYTLSIDQDSTIGYITGTGDGDLIIIGDANILENEDGFSINMNGHVNISGGESEANGDINLAGGIYTKGRLFTYDRAFTIGSVSMPSSQGVVAGEVEVNMGDLTIHTTGTALQYYNDTPAEGEGMMVASSSGKTLTVASSNIATLGVNSIQVSGGGKINLTYSSSLGTFTPQASHWPWTDMTGTEEENPDPITVNCEEGTNTANKYRMTTSAGNFLLESTAGTLYQLGWNIPDAEDSVVTNGTVRVIAANGKKNNFGGYVDYSIEAGSTVTIELLPDYGYQYVSGGLNGNQTMPDEGKASYTFIMPSNHLHLSAIFEKTSDKISVNSDKISAASIVVPNGEINGSAAFTVNNASNTNASSFTALSAGRVIGSYLDMSLNEVIYKGTTNDSWVTNITELNKPMTVKLSLASNLSGYTDYSILRDHNGTVSKLDCVYDPIAKTISFNTDKYSTYAIAYNPSVSTSTIKNPQTYDGGIRTQICVGILSLVGLVGVFLQRRSAKMKNSNS